METNRDIISDEDFKLRHLRRFSNKAWNDYSRKSPQLNVSNVIKSNKKVFMDTKLKNIFATILMFTIYAYPICTQSTPAQAALTTLEVISNIASLLSIVLDKTDEIHRIQIIDLRSRANGVITTIKEREEANRNAEETLQIVEVDLNQSMDLTWSLVQEFLKNNSIENAALFTKLYTALGQLKIVIYRESERYSVNEVSTRITNKINELSNMFSNTCISFIKNELAGAYNTYVVAPIIGIGVIVSPLAIVLAVSTTATMAWWYGNSYGNSEYLKKAQDKCAGLLNN